MNVNNLLTDLNNQIAMLEFKKEVIVREATIKGLQCYRNSYNIGDTVIIEIMNLETNNTYIEDGVVSAVVNNELCITTEDKTLYIDPYLYISELHPCNDENSRCIPFQAVNIIIDDKMIYNLK